MKPKPIMPVLPRLREMLKPDFDAGTLRWRSIPEIRSDRQGEEAGSWCRDYKLVRVDGVRYATYRVLWAMYYGEEPPSKIDHRDRNSRNNAISNLRDGTNNVNETNISLRSDSSSGINGVFWKKRVGKWLVRFKGKHVHQGADFFEACCARKSAENQYWGAHG